MQIHCYCDTFTEDKELHVPYENDAWLVRFLRPTKFYPESAHKLVSTYEFVIICESMYEHTFARVFISHILAILR